MLQERLAPLRERSGLDQLSFRLGVLLGQPPLIDATLRLFSAGILPPATRRRFLFSGMAADDLSATLRAIRSLADWPRVWAAEGRRQEALARVMEAAEVVGALSAGAPGAAVHWRNAALAYHFAQAAMDDHTPHLELTAARLAAFARAASGLRPPAEPVVVPWPTAPLPGYLRRPPEADRPVPLVVLFNGAGIVKEEMTLWSAPFLARGMATLAFDLPGSGELRGRIPTDVGQEDITTALLAWAAGRPDLDAARVALLGVSFGGALVIHHAACNPAVAACVSVTPPFHPPPYVDRVHPFVIAEIATLCGLDAGMARTRAADLSCLPFVGRVHCPTLVVGAALDAIVPPTEARRLYNALPGPKTFLFLRRATHVGLSHLDIWTAAAADWLAGQLGVG
jgi:dienelactone hydrolase